MGQTIVQKIVARAAGLQRVEPGEYVNVTPDYTCCQDISWPARKKIMQDAGVDRLARPDKLVMVVDHTTSAGMGTVYHRNHGEMRRFAEATGANFYGPGSGLRHQVLIEEGYARPGLLVFTDEPNIASIGVVGALNLAMSTEVVVTSVLNENWMVVPRPVRITLTGQLRPGADIRDLAQLIIRDFARTDHLSQACVQYDGPGVASLSLDERQALLACTYHAGADTALMPVDALALRYAEVRAGGRFFEVFADDPDAVFHHEAVYDLSEVEPMVTEPPELFGAVSVGAVSGRRIDQAAIASCASARMDDLRAAAAVLNGRRIAPHVTMYITPASREIYAEAGREGLLSIFAEAGATVLAPGCTTCWGYEGFLNDGEVSITTQQMNYNGRNGSRSASVYLAGPAVVAASAVAGAIADPRDLLAKGERAA
ncbi:aconitase family protein [Jiella sp. M17.18]|uniref:aconitase family protein n=1 Tax=Jiella sp. M17.18 TaxID=3234247 RepID=UPI0034DE9F8C